jgi:hypothetical protein
MSKKNHKNILKNQNLKKEKANMGWPNHPMLANGGSRSPLFGHWKLLSHPRADMGWLKLVRLKEYDGGFKLVFICKLGTVCNTI